MPSLTMLKKSASFFLLSLIVFGICISTPAFAQNIPRKIHYQGLLTNKNGAPLNGAFTVIIRIYDQVSGGVALYTESHDVQILNADRGIFDVTIGSVEPLLLDFDVEYWFSIEVVDSGGASDGEMTPRQKINSVPYGLNADRLDGLDSKQFVRSDADGSLDGNLTIFGTVIVEGALFAAFDIGDGTASDYFIIDSPQDSPDMISLVFGENNDERLEYSLSDSRFTLTDDLSILGSLTVTGFSWLEQGIDVNNNQFHVDPTGDVTVGGNLSVLGNTALQGNTVIGDDPADTLSLLGQIDTDLTFTNAAFIRSLGGDITLDPAGDIYLGIESTDDTVLTGDLTVQGNDIYSSTMLAMTLVDDNVQFAGNLTIQGSTGLSLTNSQADIIFGNGEYIENDTAGTLGIGGNLSISADLTTYGTGISRIRNGSLIVGDGTPTIASDPYDVFITGDLEIVEGVSLAGSLTFGGLLSNLGAGVTVADDLTITGVTFIDELRPEANAYIEVNGDIDFIQDVTYNSSSLFTSNNHLIDPVQGGQGFLTIGNLTEGDSVLIGGDVTISGALSVAGIVPTLELVGTSADTFTIDTDDTSDTPSLIFEDTNLDEYLRWNDLQSQFEFSDDVSVAGYLTVQQTLHVLGSGFSQFVNGSVRIGSSTPSDVSDDDGDMFVSGDIEIGGDLSIGGSTTIVGVVFGDDGVTVRGDLTVTETLFVDTILNESTGEIAIGNNNQTISFDTSDWDISTTGDMTNFGNITMDGTLALTQDSGLDLRVFGDANFGNGSADTHRFRGTTWFGLSENVTISDTGDLTVEGDIQLGDTTADTFSLSSSGLNIAPNGTITDTSGEVVVNDNLSISGELSVNEEVYIYGTGASRILNGRLWIGTGTPSDLSDDAGDAYITNDVQVGGDLSLGNDFTLIGTFFAPNGLVLQNDLTITETLFVDAIRSEADPAITFESDVLFSQDITVATGNVFSVNAFTLNPNQHGAAYLYLGQPGDNDVVQIEGSLTISNDLTVGGIIYGVSALTGTIQPSFTIDTTGSSNTPTLYLFDTNGSEYLRWNKTLQMLELSDDLSIDGGVTLYGDLRVEGGPGNISYFNGANHTVQITDGKLQIYQSGTNKTPSSGFDDDGDLFVEGDMEIAGDISLGGSTTIAGVVFGDDYVQITGALTVTNDLDVRGRMFDGLTNILDIADDLSVADDLTVMQAIYLGTDDAQDDYLHFASNTEALFWDESADNFNLTDDLSILGDLTVTGSTYLGDATTDQFSVTSDALNVQVDGTLFDNNSAVTILDDVTVSGELSIGDTLTVQGDGTSSFTGSDVTLLIQDGSVQIRSSSESYEPSAEFIDDGDLYVEDELEVGSDLSLGQGLTVLGSIFFGDSNTDLFILTSSGLNVSRVGTIFDYDSQLIMDDDVSITGELSVNDLLVVDGSGLSQFVNGHVQIGSASYTGIADDDGDLYVQGDVEIGGDLSIAGDTTIAGVVFGDDYTQITGNLTILGDVDVRGLMYNGATGILSVKDNITVSGDLTVAGSDLFIGYDDNNDDKMHFSGNSEEITWVEVRNEFFISDDVSISGALSVNGGRIDMPNSYISENLSTSFTAISAQNNTLALFDNVADQSLIIFDDASADFLRLDMTEDPNARILASGDLRLKATNDNDNYIYLATPANVPTLYTDASSILRLDSGADSIVTASGDSLDVDNNTLYVDAANNRVGVLTSSPDYPLEVIGDTRISQNLTVAGSEIVLNESETDSTIYFANRTQSLAWDESPGEFDLEGPLSVTGSVTISGTLRVGSAVGKGVFNIIDNDDGDIEASSMMDSKGDLFIDGDQEITGDVSIGNVLTVANTFHVGSTSGAAAFNVIDSDGVVTASSLMNDANDLYIEGDIEILGNLSMGGDTTIVGVIFSDDGTTVIGDLTVTDTLFTDNLDDEIGLGLTVHAPATFNYDLTLNDTTFYSAQSLTINPDPTGAGIITLGGSGQGDEIFLNGNTTLIGDLSVSGDFTTTGIIYGEFSIDGTISDSFTIDLDDSSDSPTLYFYDADGNEYITWNDLNQILDISDDMSVAGGLTLYGDLIVQGGSVNASYFNGSDTTVQITDGNLLILSNSTNLTNSAGFADDGDLYVEGDVEIAGSLSLAGDATIAGVVFSDDYTQITGALTVTGDLDIRGNTYDGLGDTIEILDNLSITGNLNADGTGTNVLDGDLSVGGNLTVGGDTVVQGDMAISGSLSIGADTTIAGVIFGDDYTQVEGALTITEDLDVRGNIYDGAGDQVDVVDDLSLTGALSLTDYLRVGRDGSGTLSVGGSEIRDYNVIGDAGLLPDGAAIDADNDLLIGGSVEIDGHLDIDGTGLNDFEGRLELGSITTEGGSNPGDLAIGGDLTVVGNNIDSTSALLLNAGQANDQPVYIGTTTHTGIADEGGDLFVLNDVEIGGSLSIAGDTTIAGVIFSDSFTQIQGALTVTGDLDVRGRLFDGADVDIDITDNLSVSGDLTVWNNLLVYGSEVSQIENGRLLIGNGILTPSVATGAADVYVAGDMEIHGDLSIGGNTTIAGVIFSDDATQIIGDLTVQGNLYPAADDTYDLGSATAEWRDLYVDGTANIDSLIADTADINGGTIDNNVIGGTTPTDATFTDLTVNDNTVIGEDDTDSVAVYGEFVSDLIPDADATYDLGAAAKGWNDLYLGDARFILWGNTERFTFDSTAFTMSDDLSIAGVLTVDGTAESSIAGYLNIASTTAQNVGDVGLSGDLTVEDSARIGSDGTGVLVVGGVAVQSWNAFADSGETPDNLSVISDNDLFISGTVEIDGQIDIDGTGLNDLEGRLELGAITTEGGSNPGDLAIAGDLTVGGDNIDSINALLLNAGKASAQPVFIGTTTHTGIADEGGDLYVLNDVEVGGDLSIGGETTIAGMVFSQGSLTVSGDLDVRGSILDGAGDTVEIIDNLSVTGVINSDGTGMNIFDGSLSVAGDTTLGSTLYVASNVEIGGDLSIAGDTTIAGVVFSDDYLLVQTNITIGGHLDVRESIFDGLGDTVEFEDNVSVSGVLNVDGTGVNQFDGDVNVSGNASIGNDLTVFGDVIIGGDLSVAGDTTIAGVVFSDDYTQIQGNLTVTDDMDVRGNIFDGAEVYLDILDDLSITGTLSLTNNLQVGRDGTGTLAVGGAAIQAFNAIGDAVTGKDNASVSSDNDLYIEGTLEIDEQIDIDGTGLNDLEGRLELGNITTEGGSNPGDLAIGGDLTIVGGNIDSNAAALALNADKASDQPVFIGTDSHTGIADEGGDLFVLYDVEIGGDLSVGGSVSIGGVVFSDDYTQIQDNLTVNGDLDVRQNILDGAGDQVDVRDDLSVTGALSLTGYVQVGRDGSGTIAVGGASVEAYNIIGDSSAGKDNASIDGDDDLYLEGTLEVDEQIDVDGTGLNDFEGRMELGSITTEGGSSAGDMAISGDLTVVGGNLDSPNTPLLLNSGKGAAQPVFIGTNTHTGIADEDGDLFILNDVEIGGDLSIAGSTTIAGVIFTDDYLYVTGSLSVTGDLDVRGNILDGAGVEVDVTDDLSVTGALSLTNHLQVGRDGSGTIAIGGIDVQAYNAIADSVATKGNASVSSDNDLYIEGTVEIDEQIDIDGTGLNDLEGRLELGSITTEGGSNQGDLAISGDLTIVGGNIDSNTVPLVLNAGKASAQPVFIGTATHTGIADEGGDLYVLNDAEVRGDLSIGGSLTIDSFTFTSGTLVITDDLDVQGNIYDSTAVEVDIADALSVSNDLTVDGGVLYVNASNNRVGINTTSPSVTLDIVGSAQTTLDMTIGNNLSVAGQILPTRIPATMESTFIIDYNDLSNTPTLQFEDATEDETLLWNDGAALQTFELSDDLSLHGQLTLSDNALFFNNGATIDNLTSQHLIFSETKVTFSNDVTIGGDLTIMGGGLTGLLNGRMIIGDPSNNTIAIDPGDLYVEGDVEVDGSVFATTIIGALEADGTTQPHFILNQNSGIATQDVTLYFGDDTNDTAHFLKWDDTNSLFGLSNDTTITGTLTLTGNLQVLGGGSSLIPNGRLVIGTGDASTLGDDAGDLFVTGDAEIGGDLSIGGDVTIAGVIFGDDFTQIMNNLTLSDDIDVRGNILDGASDAVDVLDSLSVSGDLTIAGGDIRGLGITNIDLGEESTNVITVTGDLSVSGDATISGNLSVAGTIAGADNRYVNVTGDTMIGTLFINTPAALALDIDGDIEYTGSLMNKSPAKFQDGIQIVNLGGIAGGQILGKDIVVALENNIELTHEATGRRVHIPQIKFVRYTRMTPTVSRRDEYCLPAPGGFLSLNLKKNEHLIHIKQIQHPLFRRDVGRDGELTMAGDYKLGTPRKIFFNIDDLDTTKPILLSYSVRIDQPKQNLIEHTLQPTSLVIASGAYIVYLEEIPLDEISEHDTAAMSPRTELVLRVQSLAEYDYSADRYIVAVITEDDYIAQYVKVSK